MAASKYCSKCGEEKLLSEFHKNNKYRCKFCVSAVGKKWRKENPGHALQWVKDNPERYREIDRKYRLKSLYGLTIEQYDTILEEQNGVCAICQNECLAQRALSVDHCHETGKVRGLLCRDCNRSLGGFKDSQKMLERALNYLRQYETEGN